jgi:hypothetical protein
VFLPSNFLGLTLAMFSIDTVAEFAPVNIAEYQRWFAGYE